MKAMCRGPSIGPGAGVFDLRAACRARRGVPGHDARPIRLTMLPCMTLPLSGWALRVVVTLNQPSQYGESGPRRVSNSSRT
ncbi:hypothetical protein D0Z08_04065 [Nocardioides immobilis]|uniref:Uncharacterized protein n=1 Tax=Nocardioides immobilis TaxID=2049295 RepID=A0A417Y646_9ACTN|nr:hypothetical protein D0Z08_04065 [Nocardioides immobilis]